MRITDESPPRARPVLRHLSPAQHGGTSAADLPDRSVRADFSTSVNAYGPSPVVIEAMRDAMEAGALGAYPDPASRAARAAIAAACAQPVAAVAVGAGAAELILTIALAFVRPGDRVLVPRHAFEEYGRAAVLAGARPAVMPESPSDEPADQLPQLVRHLATLRPRVAFLCTPESPAGRVWSRAVLREVADACARSETLLVLDQSFDAFAAVPLGTPALAGHPAVLHLRSLTKDHGLAGVRVGYVVGHPAVVAAVERARMPWTVSALAQAAAVATCEPEAQRHVAETTSRLRAASATLRADIARLGANVVPTDVHYFLVRVGDATAFAHALQERHALRVRDCTSFGLPEHVRVAARTAEENRLLLDALTDALGRISLLPEAST